MENKREDNVDEQRFNCMVCMCPRLRMVFGVCQHKFCVDCLYNQDGSLRISSCPMCNKIGQFPLERPIIPDDNIEIQKRLGIVECPNEGCSYEMWVWDQEHHLSECPNRQQLATKKSSNRKKDQNKTRRQYLQRKSKAVLRRSTRHMQRIGANQCWEFCNLFEKKPVIISADFNCKFSFLIL